MLSGYHDRVLCDDDDRADERKRVATFFTTQELQSDSAAIEHVAGKWDDGLENGSSQPEAGSAAASRPHQNGAAAPANAAQARQRSFSSPAALFEQHMLSTAAMQQSRAAHDANGTVTDAVVPTKQDAGARGVDDGTSRLSMSPEANLRTLLRQPPAPIEVRIQLFTGKMCT